MLLDIETIKLHSLKVPPGYDAPNAAILDYWTMPKSTFGHKVQRINCALRRVKGDRVLGHRQSQWHGRWISRFGQDAYSIPPRENAANMLSAVHDKH